MVTFLLVTTSLPSRQIHQFVGARPVPQAACFAQPMYTALSRNVRSPPVAMPYIYPPRLPTTTPPITRTSAASRRTLTSALRAGWSPPSPRCSRGILWLERRAPCSCRSAPTAPLRRLAGTPRPPDPSPPLPDSLLLNP